MFPTDSSIEATFEDLVNEQVKEMVESLNNIDTINGLEQYIRKDKKALDNLITLLGMSKEKFKRVVSLVRLSKGYTFDSEWEPSRLRKEMVSNKQLMMEFCELFSNGYVNPKFTSIIPNFILSDFKINGDVLARLQNRDYLKKLVKEKVVTDYNGKCSASYTNRIHKAVQEIAIKNGLEYGSVSKIPNTNITNVNAIHLGDKYVVINIHFSLTTSSGQTDYYKDYIAPLWEEVGRKQNILMINILDGAGWIGRPADFNKIYYSCNNFLNLKRISELDRIIKEFFKIEI